jgi:anti-sigma-K factor RskA
VEQGLIHDLAAAYALDALDDSERREFEDHLAGCEQCSDELDGLRDAAAALAYVPEGPVPPAALRARLLDRVHEEHGPTVVPLRRRLALPAAATLALAGAAAAIVLAVWVSSLSDSLDQKRAAIGILADRAARHVALGTANELVVASNGEALLVSDLPAAPRGKTYELWVLGKGAARPAGLFTKGKSGAPILLARRVPKGAQVGLSLERAGGAPGPTYIVSVSPTV